MRLEAFTQVSIYPFLLLVFTQMETYSTHWSSLYIFLKLVILR